MSGRPRWDGDERGVGVADATGLLPRIDALRDEAARPDWVAEDPTGHLWPHLERAIARPGAPWRTLGHHEDAAGCLVVDLEWIDPGAERPEAHVRVDAMTLIGEIVEGSTFVRTTRPAEDGGVEEGDAGSGEASRMQLDLVTGSVDDDTRFAGHGHTVRLRIVTR